TVTDANGCTGVDSVNVFVNAAPIVNINNDVPASVCPGYDTTLTVYVPFGTGPFTYAWSTTEATVSINVTPAVTTTYYVTVFDAGLGCYGYDSTTVEVYAAPTIDMNGPYQSCGWGEINFNPVVTAGPAIVDIQWTQDTLNNPDTLFGFTNTLNPTVALNDQTPGTYKVYLQVTDANGCVAVDSVWVTITLGPSISAGSDQYVCEGTTVTLAGSGGGTYAWYNAPGYAPANLIAVTAIINVTPDTTTTYYLRVNHDSCGVAMSQVTVYVHPETPVFFDGLGTDYCEVDGQVTLTNISPLGGTWSGEGVVNGVLDPTTVNTLGAPITITYTYADNSVYP
ncbi:MAG: hypothetical protein IH599_07690, partial [Bacteroidales bacterium]|nr:hypothetical protein [Bacteroidales bacterium]